jgi:tRNA pseudouridine38-40 synthase
VSGEVPGGFLRSDAAELPGGHRVRLDLVYDGAGFHGWQIQPGLRTVQGELTVMLARLLRREIVPVGAGRTDAGVHARGQVCSFSVRDDRELTRLRERLARTAPPDLQLLAVRAVSPLFNARFSATARRYSYQLLLRPDIFRARFAVFVPGRLDRATMDAAAAHFSGTRDFASFCKRQSLRPEGANICTVDHCGFEWTEDSAILNIRADHFLHNMVRAITGTLVEVGLGRRRPDDVPLILAARDRARAGRTMPAHGLFLDEVSYPAVLLDPHHAGTTASGGADRPPAREEEA